MAFISLNNISKSFKVNKRKKGVKNALKSIFKPNIEIVHAIKDISFDIDRGEIVGYIGPNGAGKSTTIKILCGILVPDDGECLVNGKIPWKDREGYVKNIGVVFGQRSQLWWDIPVIDSFELLKDIYKLKESDYERTKNELVELLNLEELLKTPVRQLSLGQRMRCEIAASLLHEPKILFLDEPTIGLDAVSKIAVRNFIKKINKEKNVTVILTTHDMSDIEALANRIILIGKGQILYDGNLSSIKQKYIAYKKLEILGSDFKKIPLIDGVEVLEKNNSRILLNLDIKKTNVSYILTKYAKTCVIDDVNVYEEDIDDIIAKMYEEHKI
jgi:ABC-2 type transport system ATP-binding protein